MAYGLNSNYIFLDASNYYNEEGLRYFMPVAFEQFPQEICVVVEALRIALNRMVYLGFMGFDENNQPIIGLDKANDYLLITVQYYDDMIEFPTYLITPFGSFEIWVFDYSEDGRIWVDDDIKIDNAVHRTLKLREVFANTNGLPETNDPYGFIESILKHNVKPGEQQNTQPYDPFFERFMNQDKQPSYPPIKHPGYYSDYDDDGDWDDDWGDEYDDGNYVEVGYETHLYHMACLYN